MNTVIEVIRGKVYQVPRHQHEHWELCLCTGTGGSFLFAESELPYQEGDVLIIPPEVPHAHQVSDGSDHIHLYIADTTLSLRSPALIQDDANQSLLHLFADMHYFFQQDAQANSSLLSAYAQLICQHISSRRMASPRDQMVSEIAQSIAQNYTNPNYELDVQLRSAPYCYDYLCRLFRQEMHTTPHKYLSDLRLQSAAEKLRQGTVNITEVAHLCGHSDPLYFSRMFKKKYGVSPRAYGRTAEKK